MHELQRLTTEFIDAEDRLRITGETVPGGVIVLWFTQRMLNRLVCHLCAWLEQQGGAGLHTDLRLEFEQQAALAALTPQAPVAIQPTSTSVLVRSVDLVMSMQGVRLSFKGQEAGPIVAGLELTTPALHQWLGIVYQQYRVADWSTQLWPEWFVEGHSATASRQAVSLH